MSDTIEKLIQDLNPNTSQFRVLTYLAFKGPSQPNAISEETGMPPGTVRPALRGLLDKKYVSQLDDGTYKSMISFTDFISYLYSQNKK